MQKNNVKRIDFSIVVCCYCGEKTIVSCLNSLIDQKYSNSDYEIVIVDDGSIDNSSDVIIRYVKRLNIKKPFIRYYRTENNGLSKARNFGIHHSNGRYILFIDEDAEADKNWLKEYSKLIFNSPFDIISGKMMEFPNSSIFQKFITRIHYTHMNPNGKEKIVLIGTNMGFNRDLFTGDVGFIDAFSYRGDETALLTLLNGKGTLGTTKNAIVYHEQPKNIFLWLKERFVNGVLSIWIDELSKQLKINNTNRLELFYIKQIARVSSWVWIPLSILSTFNNEIHNTLTIIIIVSFTIFLKRFFNRLNGKWILLSNNYSTILVLLLWPITSIITMLGVLFEDVGRMYERITYKNKLFNKSSFAKNIIIEINN